MDVAEVLMLHAQFDPGEHLDPKGFPGGTRLRQRRQCVVIGNRQAQHPCAGALGDQFGGCVQAIGMPCMRVQVHASRRHVHELSPSPEQDTPRDTARGRP